jgi:uncharacterized protein involved in exopolysaccharide biosynthesis
MHRAQTEAQSSDIDIASLVRAVVAAWKKLFLATLVVGVATFLVLSMMSPRYASEAQIEIVNEEPSLPKQPGVVVNPTAPDADSVRTQARVLQSRDLATKVASELKLANKPEYNTAVADQGFISGMLSIFGFGPSRNETEEQRVLGAYFKGLQVTPFKDSRVIGIEVRSADPELAAKIANTLVQSYIDYLKTKRLQIDRDPTPGLEREIARLESEIRGLEGDLEKARSKFGEVKISSTTFGETTVNVQQIQELSTKLNEAKSQRNDAEARSSIIRDMLQRSGQVEASPDVLKSPTIQALQIQKVRIDRQIAQLSSSLLPAHPLMRQYRAEQADLARRIRDEAQKIVISLDNEAKIAGTREATLKAELDKLVSNRGQASESTSMLRQLEANIAAKRDVLAGYQKRQNDAKVRGASQVVPITAKIISNAEPSAEPVFPKKAPITFLTMTATMLSGMVFFMIKALWSGGRPVSAPPVTSGPISLSNRVGGRLESSPTPVAARSIARTPRSAQPKPPAATMSLAEIGNHIAARASGEPGHRALIVGEDGLDIAADAAQIARQIASSGRRVVVVEWTEAGGTIASELGVPQRPGFWNAVLENASLNTAVHATDLATLDVMPMGRAHVPTDNADELEMVHIVLDTLDKSYDHVLLLADRVGAQKLFTVLEGAVDAGIVIGNQVAPPGERTFLGFAVPELEVLRHAPRSVKRPAPRRPASAPLPPTH